MLRVSAGPELLGRPGWRCGDHRHVRAVPPNHLTQESGAKLMVLLLAGAVPQAGASEMHADRSRMRRGSWQIALTCTAKTMERL